MAERPLNLRRYRKAKARRERAERAERNRVAHGLPRAERTRLARERERRERELEGKRLVDAKKDGDEEAR